MTDTTAGSTQKGRDLYAQLHPTAEERERRRAETPAPKRGEKSVAAGRALHDSRGKYAPDYAEGA